MRLSEHCEEKLAPAYMKSLRLVDRTSCNEKGLIIHLRIAIDGPSGAGKSTAAKLLAGKLKIAYIDTGAMYRAVALKVIDSGENPEDENAVLEILKDLDLEVVFEGDNQLVYIDGDNVTDRIRTPVVSKGASDVSAFKAVRLKLVELQREIASGRDVVMDGRDIGTFVFPDAEFKFYLTASEEERARRRYNELKPVNADLTFEKCLSDLSVRDKNDSSRAFAPLRMADDAVLIDSTEMMPDDVIGIITNAIKS